ncbi:MAG: HXXEE domain-containing protein [Pseudomonadota bacterium]
MDPSSLTMPLQEDESQPLSNGLSAAALSIGFAFLWVPLGQHGFLYEHWMKLGTFMMPFLIFAALSFGSQLGPAVIKSSKFIALALLCAYLIHQFEEHWIDVFGNVYAFQASVNAIIATLTNGPADPTRPLTAEGIFVINTSLVWLVGFIAIATAPNRVFPTLCMAGIVLVNGLVHIAGALAFSAYNPGLVTSIVVFLPLSIAAYIWIGAQRGRVVASIVWAILGHVIMGLGLMASGVWGAITPQAYYALLVGWSLLPGLLSAKGAFEDGSVAAPSKGSSTR